MANGSCKDCRRKKDFAYPILAIKMAAAEKFRRRRLARDHF
jgi:hypothetical protein